MGERATCMVELAVRCCRVQCTDSSPRHSRRSYRNWPQVSLAHLDPERTFACRRWMTARASMTLA
jgi:hypothetical protein